MIRRITPNRGEGYAWTGMGAHGRGSVGILFGGFGRIIGRLLIEMGLRTGRSWYRLEEHEEEKKEGDTDESCWGRHL